MIVIRDREAGNIIGKVSSFEEGNALVKKYNKEDGENFYEVVELEEEREIMDSNTIAYNAIDYMFCKGGLTVEEICDYIGCTEEDLRSNGLIEEYDLLTDLEFVWEECDDGEWDKFW